MSDDPKNGGVIRNSDPSPEIFAPAVRGDMIERVRDLVEEYAKPTVVTMNDPVSGAPALAIISHDGVKAVPANLFDDYLDAPRFRRGSATMTSLDSFIAHVDRFKTDNTAIFADENRTAPKLTAVLDYHAEGGDSAPSFGKHRTAFAFPLSDEWKTWQAKNDAKMSMADFAAFLEDHIVDVDDADAEVSSALAKLITTLGGRAKVASPTKLIELSRGLEVHENSAVKEAVKLSSGEGTISFQAEHLDGSGNALTVPTMFLIAIPVFKNGPAYQILSRLRYRKTPGGLVFWYELSRTDLVFDHAFTEAVDTAAEKTGAPVFLGSPEA